MFELHAGGSKITENIVRRVAAKAFADGVEAVETRMHPDQWAMVVNEMMVNFEFHDSTGRLLSDAERAALKVPKDPTFFGRPLVQDPSIRPDIIELRNKAGHPVARIIGLATPNYAEALSKE